MLISPPFLPLKQANETDEQWIGRAMSGGAPGDGAYPVSFNLGWHGGIHLTAPASADGAFEMVRAIADGTVVYKRGAAQAAAAPTGDEPLNYRNARTSNNVVVIRHETEIGAARQGDAPTRVVFFSIYMHLHTVRDTVRQGQRIYRKDEIGQAGYIYGDPNRIHFEIICDDANLQALIHRSTGDVPVTADGRDDAVFGELYFHLPATTLVHAQRPALNMASPSGGTALGEELFVGLRYAAGEGAVGTRGHAHITSYRPDGTTLGDALTEANAEYDIYANANNICRTYPAGHRPGPSAVYDLLRFGRVIGSDALSPSDVPHWRHIRTATGTGWVNLNATAVHKFSDADFPHWRGWTIVDDSADRDGRCDSAMLRGLLQGTTPTPLTPRQAEARLRDDAVRAKLAKTICKFPTEWEAATIEQRWGWLKIQSEENPEPLDDASFKRLRTHIDALCFWQQANLRTPQYNAQGQPSGEQALTNAHWHFSPTDFIQQCKRCGWLSIEEMPQLLPGQGFNLSHARAVTILTDGQQTARQIMPSGMYLSLNKVRRKYCIENTLRTAHFWGQIVQETDGLQTVREYADGSAYEGRAADLGNTQPGDGRRFRGRGVIQVTGRTNYTNYQNYRGTNYTTDPAPLTLQTDSFVASDASGYYWSAELTRDKVRSSPGSRRPFRWVLDGLVGINRRADRKTFSGLTDDAQIDSDVLNVTQQVNRAADGLVRRIRNFKYAYKLLSDDVEANLPGGNLRR